MLIGILEEIQKNTINDFNDYMSEENQEISTHYIVNEIYINNYISSMHYSIIENTDTIEQVQEVEEEMYKILDNYCNN